MITIKSFYFWLVFSLYGEQAQRIRFNDAVDVTRFEKDLQRIISTNARHGWKGGFVRVDVVCSNGSLIPGRVHTFTDMDILSKLHPEAFYTEQSETFERYEVA